jgi:hypothetical protein
MSVGQPLLSSLGLDFHTLSIDELDMKLATVNDEELGLETGGKTVTYM